ncbi:MAG: GNAT family N-acetyltransferase [Bacteroidetes bacterium]|jgi:GNAT superfamily N-acetyltransferase|nr:GNAT family N-acetyltransferase [Bacteroidota bacterium]
MLEVRNAGVESIGIIHSLAHAIWPDAYSAILSSDQLNYMLELIYNEASLTRQIQDLQHEFIIAYESETPIGFASFSPKTPGDLSVFHLNKLYVLTTVQGKGIGKFLLDTVIKKTKLYGATQLELNVNRYNKALHFYQKSGFTIIKKEDIDIGGGYFMNDYIMRASL